ncbi:MarR family transcriptional regulator [Actinomadura sp. PM05-2]|uniref:MarR family transcriptional regulator n=2 Tax=Actinomadura parmotrematis TaxID=2864039 RepID=A0ABS7G2B5_9ACTN|nr:MarR family transcriptional regulator [Actinomadura parmotrematis]
MAGGPWPFMAMCSIGRLHSVLKKALDVELKKADLSRTGYFLLTTLALTGEGSARLSTLSRFLMMHPTSVKLTADQLERDGLVTLLPHPHDRRATLVRITGDGRTRAAAVNEALESPSGPLGALDGIHRSVFEALQPVRLAVGDLDL